MVFFNWATMQMAAKIVYYGPGLCGKTTNLSFIYAKTSPSSRGEMVSLETESDRTLFFDLLPIEVGTIGGFKTRLQLYTVPGQVFYNTTRKLVLKGVDGVVFVADSQRPMREANQESLANLKTNLQELGLKLDDIPLVFQYNKRDLKNILTIEELQADLNPDGAHPYFEASAINGTGVFETLKEVTKLTLKKLRSRLTTPEQKKPAMAPPRQTRPRLSEPPAARPVSAASLAHAVADAVESPAHTAAAAETPGASPAAGARLRAVPTSSGSAEAPPTDSGAPVEAVPEALTEANPTAAPAAAVDENATTAASAEVATPEVLSQPAPSGAPGSAEEPEVLSEPVEPDEPAAEAVAPPPMKRVKVSNQMDILAELDTLRRQATMKGGPASFRAPDVDLDSLLAGELERSRTIRRKIAERFGPDIFKKLQNIEVAVRLKGRDGQTIGTLEPLKIPVEKAKALEELAVFLTIKLERSS